jgi:transcriptional regulator with XRE-family HTH domain
MDFSIIAKAGLSQTDFSKIIGVSRVSVSKWVTGKAKPHQLHTKRITQLVTAIQMATEAGDLPLPKGMDSSQVVRRVKQILVTRLQELKATSDN